MITKKHFEAIAAKVRNAERATTLAGEDCITRRHIAAELADYFANDNPNFDRGRFLRACGVPSNEQT